MNAFQRILWADGWSLCSKEDCHISLPEIQGLCLPELRSVFPPAFPYDSLLGYHSVSSGWGEEDMRVQESTDNIPLYQLFQKSFTPSSGMIHKKVMCAHSFAYISGQNLATSISQTFFKFWIYLTQPPKCRDYVCTTTIRSLVERHLFCFQLLTITNNTATMGL